MGTGKFMAGGNPAMYKGVEWGGGGGGGGERSTLIHFMLRKLA